MKKERYNFNDLIELMALLRSDNGCPWDREQTHETLKKYLIEEVYEVLEVIDSGDKKKMCEELGDLLLQIVFHAKIASEEKSFDINDVITGLCKKMIDRHPHIFGEVIAETSEQVLDNWEAIKKKEKKLVYHTDVLRDIPNNLPALMRSYKVQQKAASVGFDWDDVKCVFDKIDEEIGELKEAYKSGDDEKINEELGDALFAVVNLSRFVRIHPELALTNTINKFINRFEYIEKNATKQGKKIDDMTLKEMDELWEQSKTVL